MSNNIHISYDLHEPGKNYAKTIEAIKELGAWAKIHYSTWYVKTNLTAEQVRDRLVRILDSNDSLYVVDATNNNAAWQNISPEVSKFINERWLSRAAA